MTNPTYRLFYWHPLPGRGELVRLVLEHAGADYEDVARVAEATSDKGVATILALLHDTTAPIPPLAPPVLQVGAHFIAQTASICDFLGRRHGLAGSDEMAHAAVLQLQLTVMDVFAEAHDTHHPTAVSLTYEEQRPAAQAKAKHFVKERLPKYLRYFERVLARTSGTYFLGDAPSYADLSLFQAVEGLRYAFPNAMERVEHETPLLAALSKQVASLPNIAAYLASSRRCAFNEHGIFRHYPELDEAAAP